MMEDIPDKNDTDTALIVRYSQGDEAAFKQLYMRHRAKLYSYSLNLTHSYDLADDISYIVWEKVVEFRVQLAARAEAGTLNFPASIRNYC